MRNSITMLPKELWSLILDMNYQEFCIQVAHTIPLDLVESWKNPLIKESVIGTISLCNGCVDFNIRILVPMGELRSYYVPLIHFATFSNQIDILRLLLDHGADINACDDTGMTALHRAIIRQLSCLVGAMVFFGADVNAEIDRDSVLYSSWSPIHFTSRYYPHLLGFFVQHGADINASSSDDRLPIHHICQFRPKYLKVVIGLGGNVNAITGHEQHTPLHIICKNPYICPHRTQVEYILKPLRLLNKSVSVLIENGANVNATDNCGRTPLHFLCGDKPQRW